MQSHCMAIPGIGARQHVLLSDHVLSPPILKPARNTQSRQASRFIVEGILLGLDRMQEQPQQCTAPQMEAKTLKTRDSHEEPGNVGV